MANVYVRSGAAGTGTGADWTNAFTTLAAALTAKAAGDSFWVSEDHAETTASAITLTSAGTPGNPCFIYCVNHAGTVPPVSADLRTTATITTTIATSGFQLTLAGSAYYYGITLAFGSGATNIAAIIGNTVSSWTRMDKCLIKKVATTANTQAIKLGNGNQGEIIFNSTQVQFAATGDMIFTNWCRFKWMNTASAIQGATLPTTLFGTTQGGDAVYLEGVDLSALGSGKTIFGDALGSQECFLKDCKLGASVTVATTPTTPASRRVYVLRSDSGATNYRSEKYDYTGTQVAETSIVRTGGATDGATPLSWKLTTTANSRWLMPFEAIPLQIWCPQTTQQTVTIEGTWNSGAVPNNDDIWVDAEYLGSASTPLGSFATSTKADNLATNAALSSSSKAWGGGGSGVGWSPFKMSVTFTPAQVGPVTLYIRAAKASSTFYIDPQPQGLAAVARTYMAGSPSPAMINEHSLFRAGLHPIDNGIAA